MRYSWLLFSMILGVIAGCGPSTMTISGTVQYDGTPIEEGSITFDSPDGNTSSIGGRIENGAYTVSNVPASAAGKKIVRIFAVRKTGRKIPAGPPSPPGTMVDEINKLPTTFNEQSTLSATLSPNESNVFNFDLPATPSKR